MRQTTTTLRRGRNWRMVAPKGCFFTVGWDRSISLAMEVWPLPCRDDLIGSGGRECRCEPVWRRRRVCDAGCWIEVLCKSQLRGREFVSVKRPHQSGTLWWGSGGGTCRNPPPPPMLDHPCPGPRPNPDSTPIHHGVAPIWKVSTPKTPMRFQETTGTRSQGPRWWRAICWR